MAKNTGDTEVDKAVKTTAEWMVEALIEQGVDTVFGIPGAHTYALTDAMAKASNRIRFVHSRHEQGAGYMAYGYAKSTGKPGVFTVVPGPGVLNAGAALNLASVKDQLDWFKAEGLAPAGVSMDKLVDARFVKTMG